MTWTRLTVHWIVSDCDLGKVSIYTPSRGYVVRPEEFQFLEKGKIIISVTKL